MNRTTILIILNLLIAVIWLLEDFKKIDFIDDQEQHWLEGAFFFTLALWNISLIMDKKKKINLFSQLLV